MKNILAFLVLLSALSFAANITSCQLINSSGTYNLTQNIAGAPIGASEFSSGAQTCIKITASNVLLDLGGGTILDDGSSGANTTIGILIEGPATNVTVQNSPFPGVQSYTYGVVLLNASGDRVTGINTNNNVNGGILLVSSNNNTVTGDQSRDDTGENFRLVNSNNNNFSSDFIQIQTVSANIVFDLENSSNNTLNNDNAQSTMHNIGYEINNSNGNILNGDKADSCGCGNNFLNVGFEFDNSSNNTLANSEANYNYGGSPIVGGIFLNMSNGNNITNDTTYFDGGAGILLLNSSSNVLSGNNASLDQPGGASEFTSNGNGIWLWNSTNNTVTDNVADNDRGLGYFIQDSSGNNVTDNIAQDNEEFDFFAYASFKTACNNVVQGMNGSAGRPIGYFNGTSVISNSIFSELFLCNADNSTVDNVTIDGSDTLNNNAMVLIQSENVIVGNSTSSNNSVGYLLINSSNDKFINDVADTNQQGFFVSFGSSNDTFQGDSASGNAFGYISVGFNEVVFNIPIFFLPTNNDTFIDSNATGNNVGFGAELSAGNSFIHNSADSNGIGFISIVPVTSFDISIPLFNSSGNSFINNSATNNDVAIFSALGVGNNITGNTALNNNGTGAAVQQNIGFSQISASIIVANDANDSVSGNDVENTQNGSGFFEQGDTGQIFLLGFGFGNNSFTNNDAFNNSLGGFGFNSSSGDIIIGNNASGSNSGFGFALMNESMDMLGNNTALNNQIDGFIEDSNSNDSSFIGNNATNNLDGGFLIEGSSNLLENNTADGQNSSTFGFADVLDDNLSGNYATGNEIGFALENSNTLIRNNATINAFGFIIGPNGQGSNNTLINNSAVSNIFAGIWIGPIGGSFNVIQGNDVSNSSFVGIGVLDDNDNITNNTVHDNLLAGIIVEGFPNDSLSGNVIFNNTGFGLAIFEANNTQLSGNRYFGNGQFDFGIEENSGTDMSMTMNNDLFDSPAGNLTNYTNLSISDVLNNDAYSINWTSEPPSPPLPSFNGTFINITDLGQNFSLGNATIQSITWSWRPNPIEPAFQLYQFNDSGWTLLNDSPDLSTHSLSMTNLTPHTIYGILMTGCPLITVPGSYALGTNGVGAPNDASEFAPSTNACVKIGASNVTLDCNGFNTTDDGSSGATTDIGIFLNSSSSNVTLKNCMVSNYSYGVYSRQSVEDSFLNNTAFGNNFSGFFFDGTLNDNDTVIGNTAYNNIAGFMIDEIVGGVFANNSAYNNSGNPAGNVEASGGFVLSESANNTFTNNIAYNNAGDGFSLETSSFNGLPGNVFSNNSAFNNSFGFLLTGSSDNNTLEGNNASNNSISGISLESANTNTLTSNIADGNSNGFFISNGNGNNLTGDNASGNSFVGLLAAGTSNGTVRNSNFANNGHFGILSEGSVNSLFDNVTAIDTFADEEAAGIIVDEDSNDTIQNSIAGSNGGPTCVALCAGIAAIDSFGSVTLINDTAFNNTGLSEGDGILVISTFGQTSMSNMQLHNNTWEINIDVGEGAMPVNITDAKLGNVRISLNDNVTDGFELNDTTSPANPPHGLNSFHNKYLKVQYFSTGFGEVNSSTEPEIDNLTFLWNSSESSLFNPSSVKSFTFNGTGWNQTPNQTNNIPVLSVTDLNLSNITSDDIYGLFATLAPTSTGGGSSPSLQESFSSNCSGNVVTVTSGGDRVQGATVVVNGFAQGSTDSNGQYSYPGCGNSDTILSRKDGYAPTENTPVSEVACYQCAPVQCACGVLVNNSCQKYSCCSDSDCPSGTLCQDHSCVKPKQECTPPSCCKTSDQCSDNQQCLDSTGAPPVTPSTGSCLNITGQCGITANHTFVSFGYECGSEAGCPACPNGGLCLDHKCVQGELNCPSSGFIGDNQSCSATQNGQACKNCDLQITDPTGKQFGGRTDENGNFDLPLSLNGTYTLTLLKNGTTIKSIQVKALPRAQPSEQPKPSAGPDFTNIALALLILLILIVLGILYWRSRQKK